MRVGAGSVKLLRAVAVARIPQQLAPALTGRIREVLADRPATESELRSLSEEAGAGRGDVVARGAREPRTGDAHGVAPPAGGLRAAHVVAVAARPRHSCRRVGVLGWAGWTSSASSTA